jgi:DNA-binding SARP family transcriptional activator/tetratricopeptide (TPR) repeat protein
MRFGLLGTVTVAADCDRDGGEARIRPIGSAKVRALLAALLATPGRAVPLDHLKSALWGETPPTTANASLHNHVARLRRVLGEEGRDGSRLRAAPPGYVLDIAEGEFDAWIFLDHHAAARAAHRAADWPSVLAECGGALALWRGDPLSDVPLRSDGLRAFAAHLAEARLLTLEWRFDAELALGHHQGLAAELAGLAAAHPLRETFHRQLMLALHRTHRQAEALRVYHVLRRTLVDELGVEPDPAVQAAYQEILAEPSLNRAATLAGPPASPTGGPPARRPAEADPRARPGPTDAPPPATPTGPGTRPPRTAWTETTDLRARPAPAGRPERSAPEPGAEPTVPVAGAGLTGATGPAASTGPGTLPIPAPAAADAAPAQQAPPRAEPVAGAAASAGPGGHTAPAAGTEGAGRGHGAQPDTEPAARAAASTGPGTFPPPATTAASTAPGQQPGSDTAPATRAAGPTGTGTLPVPPSAAVDAEAAQQALPEVESATGAAGPAGAGRGGAAGEGRSDRGPGAAEVVGARPAPAQLPADVPDFTGRVAELDELLAALRGPRDGHTPRVVVVSGMGGVGKTALAVRAAHLLRDEFPDGRLYADLRGFGAGGARHPSDLLARFLGDLGADCQPLPEDPDDRTVLWRDALHGRRVLLVLDNAGDAAQVAPLLPGDGDSAVVVTSRRTLADLPGTARLALKPLSAEEQRELLVTLCGAQRVAAEPEAAAGVLAACGGLPLALRIAGARMAARPNWPLTALAERLDGPGLSRLHALSAGGLAVQETFAMSYVAMRDSPADADRAAACAFRLLGAWPGHGFEPSAAAALLGRDSAHAAADVLEALVDAHLLETPRPGHYTFHDLVGEYAAVCALAELPPAERRHGLRRITVWYTATVASTLSVLTPEGHPLPPLDEQPVLPALEFETDEAALDWCVRELPAIKESIRLAIAYGWPDLAWRTAAGLFGYAQAYWWTGEWTACLEQAMACVSQCGDLLGQAWMHSRLGVAYGMAERYEVSLGHLHVARRHFELAGDRRGVAAILTNLTGLHRGTGEYVLALEYGRRSLELHRSLGDYDRVATVLGNLGDTYLCAGDPEAAEECFCDALAAWRTRGSLVSIARTLTSLGEARLALGRPADAVDALAETLTLLERLGDRATMADVLEVLGRAHLARGDRAAARTCWEEAVEVARQHRLPAKEEAALRGLAALAK